MDKELLEFLEKQPIEKWNDLLDYFSKKYTNYNEIAKDLKLLIDELLQSGLIRLSDMNDYIVLGSIRNNGDDTRVTFEDFRNEGKVIKAKITFAGRSYLFGLRNAESQEQINIAQSRINLFIMIFTGLLTIVAIITLTRDIYKSQQEDKKPLQELQKQLQSTDSTLSSRIKIDSAFQKQVKDSLKILK